MEVVEIRTSVWEALAGRAPGRPPGPGDPDLWRAVVDRLNPAKALPVLRAGIEQVAHTSVRGEHYVMLRSPDRRESRYLRLTSDEVALAQRMDGSRTVAALVGEFARISGRLAPEQVLRVVADLAANRMLDELPIDAFVPLERVRARHRPLPVRIGRGMLTAARGQRVVLADPDRAAGLAYRWGGKFLFTRTAAALLALVIIAGLAAFVNAWAAGAESVFLVGDSYLTGALVLLGLNVVALACHEFGHALAAKHAGRRVPAMGVLMYFGIPSVFVDTTDVWMADRRARLVTSMAGPIASLAFAGGAQLVALAFPSVAPVAFKLAFVWYLNTLFNLNPLMALDGYYALMDWLEIPNLRPRAIGMLVSWARHRTPRWFGLDREGRMIACYAVLAVLWLIVMVNILIRLYRDRVSGIVVGLWHTGLLTQLLLVAIVAALLSPLGYAVAGWVGRRKRHYAERRRERRRDADLPRRVETLYRTDLRDLPADKLTELARNAHWTHPSTGEQVVVAGAAVEGVLVVAYGALEARRPGDPPGTIRARALGGELIGVAAVLTGGASALTWLTVGTGARLLTIPAGIFTRIVGPLIERLPAETAEAETLLADAPAFAALSEVDRLAVLARMRAVDMTAGLHAGGDYPPLTPRPGAPGEGDDDADRRLLKRLAVLLLLFALLTGAVAARDGIGWAEMPNERVLLTVERGTVTTGIGGETRRLDQGAQRYLTAGDNVAVARRSIARLTYRGGGQALLCPTSTVAVRAVSAKRDGSTLAPSGVLGLDRGVVLADSSPRTSAIAPLTLTVDAAAHRIVNDGPARFSAVPNATNPVTVHSGHVDLDGVTVPPAGAPIRCPVGSATDGAGQSGTPPASAPPSTTTATAPPTTSTTSTSPAPETTTDPPIEEVPPTPVTTTTTTEPGTLITPPPAPQQPPPPPPGSDPTIGDLTASASSIEQQSGQRRCPTGQTTSLISVTAHDGEDGPGKLTVRFSYRLAGDPAVSGTTTMTHERGDTFTGTLGPFASGEVPPSGGRIEIIASVRDSAGNETTSKPIYVTLGQC